MKRLFMLCLALIALSAVPLFANGVLVVDAEDGDCMQLLSSTVSVQVEDQVAIVTSTQEFTNQFNWPYFPKYAFPLPVGASATRLRWYLNETWYTAIISAVPQDSLPPGPGESWAYNLRQYLGSSPMYYNFEQAVLADQDIKVELTYAMLLPYANGNVNFLYPNDYQWIQSSALDSQILEFDIISQRTIQNVVLQNFSPGIYTNDGNHAHLSLTRLNVPANSNYVLYYTLSLDELGLFTMSTRLDEVPDAYGNGYFLFVAEPDPSDNTEIINKVFTLMIDRSGSMSGTKIVQARNAANFVINHLNPGDMFNIVSFASQVSSFRTEHVPFTTSNQTAALSYIAGLYASGSTNISEAFSTAIPQFNQATDETANIIIFFTDGQPTAGLTNPDQIRTHVTNLVDAANTEIYLYNFGIGSDVNVQLLTWLALDNNGLAEFLGSNDFETTISNFYMTIANPVLIHPTLSFSVPDNISETYPQPLPNLYLGTQMIVAGRYNSPGNINVTLSGQAFNNEVSYTYPMDLSAENITNKQFIPKIWASQKINYLMGLYHSYPEDSAMAEMYRQMIIDLSLAYGVISPFTSFTGGVGNDDELAPDEQILKPYVLKGNYPNPFNPSTTIRFEVKKAINKMVQIRIFNLKGQLIKVLALQINRSGNYEIVWDGTDNLGLTVSSGTYYYVIDFGDAQLTGKMSMIK